MINELTVRASRLAHIAYEGQMYGARPYTAHLQAVVDSVSSAHWGAHHICVAWLHDILEDTPVTVSGLRGGFPEVVVDAVVALTKVDGESYSEYIEKVAANPVALVVKIHDTLCNLTESVKGGSWGRVKKYSKQLTLLADYK